MKGGEVVDSRKLNEGGEDKGKANGNEPIHSRCVGDFWEGVASTDAERCHGQDSSDT